MILPIGNNLNDETAVTQSVSRILDNILCGDVWQVAARLPSSVAQCIVTSPPYFGHRVYTQEETARPLEFGRETNCKEYTEKLVSLFADLRRCLKADGTLWLNLGDTYRDGQLLGVPGEPR